MPSLNTKNAILSNAITVDSSYNVAIGGTPTAIGGYTSLIINNNSTGSFLDLNNSGINNLRLLSLGLVDQRIQAQGTLRFDTAGIARMAITSDGNVGIGTSTPTAVGSFTTLAINGSVGSILDLKSNGTTGLFLFSNATSTVFSEQRSAFMSFETSATERMRITSGGNVGIGTSSPVVKFQTKVATNINLGIQGGTADSTGVKLNSFNDAGSANIPMELNASLLYFKTDENERMRITNAGKVGIGATSVVAALQVYSTRIASFTTQSPNHLYLQSEGYSGSGLNTIDFGSTSYGVPLARIGVEISGDGTYMKFGTSSSYATGITNTALTINPSGNVLIGTTAAETGALTALAPTTGTCAIQGRAPNGTSAALIQSSSVTTASTSWYAYVAQSGNGSSVTTNTMFVYGNGNIVNVNNSYGTLSDIALKENIIDATSKLEDILKLKVKNFNLIADENKTKQIGFIAQELEQVFPNMIEIDNKSGMKSIKTSVLIPMLVKAVQEQQAQIEVQQQQINSLINR